MTEMRLVVVGAAGRMGRMLVKAVAETQGCRLVGAIEREGSTALGQDAGCSPAPDRSSVDVTEDPLPVFAEADGVLDFTAPAATVEFAALAAQARIVHVVGTTGLQDDDFAKLEAAARHARIVQSGNMSLGVNLLAGLVRQGRRGARRGVRHRDPGDAPPHEGGRALRHRAAPRRGRRAGAARSPSTTRSVRVARRPYRRAPARAISALRPCAAARSSASTA